MRSCAQPDKGRTPASRLPERDAHLLAVAERLFLEQGYHQVSLALVATSAGVATRTIYARFGDKRSLLEVILERREEASSLALVAIAGQGQSLEASLHRFAAHVFQHELSPCLALLHADLLAERNIPRPAQRRWALEGSWRTLLERALMPSNACLVDVFVACLQNEHLAAPMPHAGNEWSAGVVDGMARRAVARFLELANAFARPLSTEKREPCI